MKSFKSHFELTRNQRNGILLLVVVLIVSLAYQYFWMLPKSANTQFLVSKETQQELQREIDSIKAANIERQKPKIFPFNPNYLNEFRAYQLGISSIELDRLLAFRQNGEWVNSNKEFQQVTQISDSLLNEITPYFKFPEWIQKRESQKAVKSKKQGKTKTLEEKKDINTATKEDLQHINGIGEVLATRIIRTRTKYNGFIDDLQLKDVYGLNYETREKLLNEFAVKQPTKPTKININTATLVQLAEIPYFDYELAREIAHFIKVREGISDFEELSKIYEFPMHKIDRIKLYLTIDE